VQFVAMRALLMRGTGWMVSDYLFALVAVWGTLSHEND
jgi:hypothetical protein